MKKIKATSLLQNFYSIVLQNGFTVDQLKFNLLDKQKVYRKMIKRVQEILPQYKALRLVCTTQKDYISPLERIVVFDSFPSENKDTSQPKILISKAKTKKLAPKTDLVALFDLN